MSRAIIDWTPATAAATGGWVCGRMRAVAQHGCEDISGERTTMFFTIFLRRKREQKYRRYAIKICQNFECVVATTNDFTATHKG
jgi:hypothetical protein